jgi:GT2 family glycosyltransferase
MCSLIAMAVYSTTENKKDEQLRKTLQSLWETVDWTKHRMMVCVNGMTTETDSILLDYDSMIENVIINDSNLGTAKAINKIWKQRGLHDNVIKIDADVIINHNGWVDEMEEAINREPKIGIIGLKRKDLIECTWHEDSAYKSVLVQLPHNPGESWIIIERAHGIMGTCKMINYKLLDEIGYLYQPTVYGFDDSNYSARSEMAGFINCFLPHINIDHIDPGGTDYTKWKADHAGETMAIAHQVIKDYASGERPLYEEA